MKLLARQPTTETRSPDAGPAAAKGRHRYTALALAIAVLMGAVAAGCSFADDENGDRPRVLTTFTVIADMAGEVAGDRVEVASITRPGSEIHGYEPTPSDLRNASGADLILWNGLELETWFEQFIDRSGAESVVLTDGVETIPIRGTSEYAGMANPHAWMSVDNAAIYVDNIATALTELDPAGADTFADNAERYKRQIAELGDRVRGELDGVPERRRLLVTCEGAFSYLARDLGLREAFIWPVNAEREGTPQQIAATVEAVRDNDVPAVFCESTVDSRPMEQVAREAGSTLAGTLYVDSLSASDGPVPTYLDLLRHDVETIVDGLTGREAER